MLQVMPDADSVTLLQYVKQHPMTNNSPECNHHVFATQMLHMPDAMLCKKTPTMQPLQPHLTA